MEHTIAFLAQGRLYLRRPGDPAPQEVVSQFVENANERARRSAERNGWKSGSGAGPELISSAMLWRNQQVSGGMTNMRIKGVTRGAGGEVMFALHTDSIGGLFAHDPADGSERRLLHKAGFRAMHLARHPSKDLVALAVEGDGFSSHIAVTDTAGHRVREITEGDSRDESPAWAPGDRELLVFQSAGVARSPQGIPAALGPYRIEQLDIDHGTMAALLEEDDFDYLSPRLGADGSLYCIRRPYAPGFRPVSVWTSVLDALLFPVRLAGAIVHFFNFFSMAFGGKPLISAGGPKQDPKETTSLMLWGKMIDAEKALKNAGKNGPPPGLVPQTWQLIRRRPDSTEETLAKGVLSFDVAADGTIIHTNGSTISRLNADGTSEAICTGKLIEEVIVLGKTDAT